MITVENYKIVNNIEIEVNNDRRLKLEFINTNKKYGKHLKITTLDAKGNKEKTIFVNESDIVLLYNLYIYKKENNEEIF